MKPVISFLLLLIWFTGVACQQNDNVAELGLQFDWAKQNECSEFSPEIHVTGLPPGTRYLDVRLTDLYQPGADHGGWDQIPCPADGIIPPGGLAHFRGPCPPKYYGGGNYEFAVRAIDANGDVTGMGKRAKECCPEW